MEELGQELPLACGESQGVFAQHAQHSGVLQTCSPLPKATVVLGELPPARDSRASRMVSTESMWCGVTAGGHSWGHSLGGNQWGSGEG